MGDGAKPSESSASPVWAIYPASGNPSTKEQMWKTLIWKIPSVFPHGIRLHKISPTLSNVVLIRSPFHIKSIITYFPSRSFHKWWQTRSKSGPNSQLALHSMFLDQALNLESQQCDLWEGTCIPCMHTSYLSFFLNRKNFKRIKFTPKFTQ